MDNIIAFLNMCVTTKNDTRFKTEGVYPTLMKAMSSRWWGFGRNLREGDV
jgi:hypothetical protein